MKRLLPLFLLLCLLLTGCSPMQPPTEPSTTVAPTTEAPTETEGTTSPTEPQPPQFQVNADFSQYTPQIPVEAKYTRLSEGLLEELRPTDTPTRIFPFPGKVLIDEYGGLYITEDRFKYGVVDENGCILADPVYSAIYLLSEKNTWEYLPYWVLEKTFTETTMWEGYEYLESDTLYAFASIDGTFVSDCIYSYITAHKDRILAFYYFGEDQRLAFDVFDLEHNRLFSSRDLPFGDRLGGGPYEYAYAEGLYAVVFEERIYAPEGYYTSEFSSYFMDESGNLVLGPYDHILPFSRGKAPVQAMDSYQYFFIDRNGSILSGEYDSCEPLPNGNVIVGTSTESYDTYELLNADLERILTLPGYYHVSGDGTIQVYDYDVAGKTTIYSPDGELLWIDDGTHYLSDSLSYTSADGKTVLKNTDTHKTLEFPEDTYFDTLGDSSDPIIIVNYFLDSEDYSSPRITLYLNKELEEIASSASHTYTSYYEIGSSHQSICCLTENAHATLYTGASTPLFTAPISDCHMADLYPDRFASLTTPDCTYLYSPDGELLFAYPINPMDD